MPKQKPSTVSRQGRQNRRPEQNRRLAQPAAEQASTKGQRNRAVRPPRRNRTSLRAGLAVVGGRVAGALSRRLHLGGGTSIVGTIAQGIDPQIVSHLANQLEYGSILVTGTNGKTTTSGFIAAILSDAGLRVWRNREGSNLMRGVASSLVIRALPNGHLRRSGKAISVFEVDEAVVPQVTKTISPRIAVFTNLFRDQLDRYGEVDSVTARWQQAVSTLSTDTTLILNADDPTTAQLGELFSGRVLYFGIDDLSLSLETQKTSTERHQVIDSRTCPHCGTYYTYDARFYSHMGHYFCENCGLRRPVPDLRVVRVQSDGFDRLRIQIETTIHSTTLQREIVIPLPGLYNIYNALAAATVAQALQIGWEPIVSGIEQFKPVFGRGERVQIDGRTVRLLLAKNPTGFNEVLRTLFSAEEPRHVLFILNDNIADGRDISWIWDVDFERVMGHTASLVTAGTRALDLALRLKYAGIEQDTMTIVAPAPLRTRRKGAIANAQSKLSRAERANASKQKATGQTIQPFGIAEALDTAIRQTPTGETLFIVPTYTGLLEIHRELERRGLTPRYWEGRDQ